LASSALAIEEIANKQQSPGLPGWPFLCQFKVGGPKNFHLAFWFSFGLISSWLA